jgi:ribonuclease VapC
LLAYLNKEEGFEKVRRILADAQESGLHLLMNEINIGETYYILFRKRGNEKAEYFLHTVLVGLPISAVANDFNTVISAARIKAHHALSFADCFAIATALQENAVILTGDPEFKSVEKLVAIDWLTK